MATVVTNRLEHQQYVVHRPDGSVSIDLVTSRPMFGGNGLCSCGTVWFLGLQQQMTERWCSWTMRYTPVTGHCRILVLNPREEPDIPTKPAPALLIWLT